MPDKEQDRPIPPMRDRNAKPGPVRGIPESQEYDPGPAPPEQSNYAHPGTVGERRSVPGAGIVSAGADVPGVTREQHVPEPLLKAPGTHRDGTTDSGPEGGFGGAGVGAPAGALDNETPSDGGKAPLSSPGRNMGPPAGAASGETNDLDEPPSATHPERKR